MVPIGLAEQARAAGTTGRLRPAGWTGNMSGTRLTGNTSSTGPAGSADVTPATVSLAAMPRPVTAARTSGTAHATRRPVTAARTSGTVTAARTSGTATRAAAGSGDEPGGVGDRPAGRHGRRGPGGLNDPEVIQVPRTIRGPVRDEDEHYIPPAPPPLPRLDPVAKGAWAALFGGPGYLVVATAAGWSVSGLAAFCAVAAFVAGFAILVLRMHDPGPGGPDDGDTGAVV